MRDQMRAQRDLSRDQWKLYRDQQRAIARRSRGGSILGPLLLVLLGVMFLLLSLRKMSYATVGIWYGHWWPLLLLLGGIVLLAEWAFERSRSNDPTQAPSTRVGGGVVFLLFLLCIPGIILNASHGDARWVTHGFSFNEDNMDEFLGDRHESDQVLDQAIPTGSTLIIDNPHGDVTITGSSDDGMVHIAMHKQVFSRSDSDAADRAAKLVPAFTVSGTVATLNLPSVESARADLTITLPTTTGTTVSADHGAIHISSLKAPVTATANHGDIEVNAIGGAVTSHMNSRGSSFNARGVRGSLTLEGNCHNVDISDVSGAVSLNGDFFGITHFERVGGGVRFHTSRTDFQLARLDGSVDIKRGELSADQIVGPVSLTARSYNVNLDRVAGDVSVTTSDGTVDVTSAPPLGNVTIQNRNGSVNLTVPEQAGFEVEAETRDGDVDSDLPLTRHEDHHSKGLTGTVGGGGPLIRINTTQNDISLKKGVIAPLPPPAPAVPSITRAPTPQVKPVAAARHTAPAKPPAVTP
jgi:DUF4097 and DUF4098 domain-containing protein YvlB